MTEQTLSNKMNKSKIRLTTIKRTHSPQNEKAIAIALKLTSNKRSGNSEDIQKTRRGK
jgi:hypothetical protein